MLFWTKDKQYDSLYIFISMSPLRIYISYYLFSIFVMNMFYSIDNLNDYRVFNKACKLWTFKGHIKNYVEGLPLQENRTINNGNFLLQIGSRVRCGTENPPLFTTGGPKIDYSTYGRYSCVDKVCICNNWCLLIRAVPILKFLQYQLPRNSPIPMPIIPILRITDTFADADADVVNYNFSIYGN